MTIALYNLVVDLKISTHTLTWSVTYKDNQPARRILYFNSHAHVERDALSSLQICLKLISTHTLTWSVTPPNYSPQE